MNRFLQVEALESRVLLSTFFSEASAQWLADYSAGIQNAPGVQPVASGPAGSAVVLDSIDVQMVPELDAIGFQPIILQGFQDPEYFTFGIFDTGASPVTISFQDQSLFEMFGGDLAIKVWGGAVAQGVGGEL